MEVAAQAAVCTSYLILSWRFQLQLSQGRTEAGGCYHTSEGNSQSYRLKQDKILVVSLKKILLYDYVYVNIEFNMQKKIILISYL